MSYALSTRFLAHPRPCALAARCDCAHGFERAACASRFRGHTVRFSQAGQYLGAYRYCADLTPAIYQHASTYSLIIKANYYVDWPDAPRDFYITQLSPTSTSSGDSRPRKPNIVIATRTTASCANLAIRAPSNGA
jgi:hypothetical protein